MNSAFAILVFLPAIAFGMNCTGRPDGNYEIGCRAYSTCTGGKWEIVTCDIGMAYNQDTGKCEDAENVPPPCGLKKDCSSLSDGKYPDLDNDCHSYYTCAEGEYMGHNFCPADLVFNEQLQICDFQKSAPPPCGQGGSSGSNPSQSNPTAAPAAPATAAP